MSTPTTPQTPSPTSNKQVTNTPASSLIYIDTSDSIAVRATLDDSLADYFKQRYNINQDETSINIYIGFLFVSVTLALGLYAAEWLLKLPPLNKYTLPVILSFFSLQLILYIFQFFIWKETFSSVYFSLPNDNKGYVNAYGHMPQYSSVYNCEFVIISKSKKNNKKNKPQSKKSQESNSDVPSQHDGHAINIDIQNLFTTQGLFLNEVFYDYLDTIFVPELELHANNKNISQWQKRQTKNKLD